MERRVLHAFGTPHQLVEQNRKWRNATEEVTSVMKQRMNWLLHVARTRLVLEVAKWWFSRGVRLLPEHTRRVTANITAVILSPRF